MGPCSRTIIGYGPMILLIGVGLVSLSCVEADNPNELSFACSAQAPCADGYYCSPVLGYCVLADGEIPCNIDADCPDDETWTCDQNTALCIQSTEP